MPAHSHSSPPVTLVRDLVNCDSQSAVTLARRCCEREGHPVSQPAAAVRAPPRRSRKQLVNALKSEQLLPSNGALAPKSEHACELPHAFRATSDLPAPRYGNSCESGARYYCTSGSRLSMISTHCLNDSTIRRSLPDILAVLKPHCPACHLLICLRTCFLRAGYDQRCV